MIVMKKGLLALALGGLSLLGVAGNSNAAVLLPNQTLTGVGLLPTQVTPVNLGSLGLGAPIISATGTYSTTGSHSVNFTYTENVYQDGAFLDFTYQFKQNTSSGDSIKLETAQDYAGFITDIYVDTAGTGTVSPSTIDRSGSGGSLAINYSNGSVTNGATVRTILVKTNAQYFTYSPTLFLSFADGGSITVPAYSPTAVPMPSAALGGLGLLGMIAGRRIVRNRNLA